MQPPSQNHRQRARPRDTPLYPLLAPRPQRCFTDVHGEATPIVEDDVAQIPRHPIQPRPRVGPSPMPAVAPVLTVQIDRRIPTVIERRSSCCLVRTAALPPPSGLRLPRPAHRDVFLDERAHRACSKPDRLEERSGNLPAQQLYRLFVQTLGQNAQSRHPSLQRQLLHPSFRPPNHGCSRLRFFRAHRKLSAYARVGVSSPLAALFGRPPRIRLSEETLTESRVPV